MLIERKIEKNFFYLLLLNIGSCATNIHIIIMEAIIKTPGLQHISEDIFQFLDKTSLKNCREVNSSWKKVLDQPPFWLKKLEEISTVQEFEIWKSVQKTKAKICLTGDTIHWIDIVSECFENKNNNCCEINIYKNAICLLIINIKIYNLVTLLPGRPSCRVVRNGFVNDKQMAFLQSFVSQQLLFLFSKHLDTMSIWRIVSPV